jgi:hypothetical protein
MVIHRVMTGLIYYVGFVTGNDGNETPTVGVTSSLFEIMLKSMVLYGFVANSNVGET